MILPQKTDTVTPVAKCDETWEKLANDKTITDIPAGAPFGAAPPTPRVVTTAEVQADLIKDGGGSMTQGQATVLLDTDDRFGNFVNSKWRPMMAFIYMITCACDFVIFPILWSILQVMSHGQVTSQWMPLTLQGAGLYHIAMGAVLGVAAYGRSQEKIAGKQ
jgi:hypothetical protein